MPIIKSAKKKLRQDRKRARQNLLIKGAVRTAILTFKKKPTLLNLSKVFSELDKAAKKKVFHGNKAARLKSRLSKLLKKKPTVIAGKPKTTANNTPPRKNKTIV